MLQIHSQLFPAPGLFVELTCINAFIKKWQHSGGNERANYQGFFLELCDALGVDRPPPKGNVVDDPYCFDKDIKVYHPSGKVTSGYIDFYKADHFIIEAKQGSDQAGKGTAKRGTPSYLKAMEKAFVQAIAYTRNVPNKPPFLLTCDIGDHFELWTGFNGDYGGYAARRDIELSALRQDKIFDEFVDIFTNPQARNPETIAAKVTREVAADLAELTKSLERSPTNSPAPLNPLPTDKENQSDPPSPRGRRAGDEGQTGDKGKSLDEQILERLVALNAERAEEERNGTIRWLRPEYQAPDEVQPTQQVIAGVSEPEEIVIAPVEQQKFPTSFKDQLATIRDLLRTQGGEWTVAQVKAQFKNASRKDKAIQDCLDTLTELGVIACHTEDATPRWYLADLQTAA